MSKGKRPHGASNGTHEPRAKRAKTNGTAPSGQNGHAALNGSHQPNGTHSNSAALPVAAPQPPIAAIPPVPSFASSSSSASNPPEEPIIAATDLNRGQLREAMIAVIGICCTFKGYSVHTTHFELLSAAYEATHDIKKMTIPPLPTYPDGLPVPHAELPVDQDWWRTKAGPLMRQINKVVKTSVEKTGLPVDTREMSRLMQQMGIAPPNKAIVDPSPVLPPELRRTFGALPTIEYVADTVRDIEAYIIAETRKLTTHPPQEIDQKDIKVFQKTINGHIKSFSENIKTALEEAKAAPLYDERQHETTGSACHKAMDTIFQATRDWMDADVRRKTKDDLALIGIKSDLQMEYEEIALTWRQEPAAPSASAVPTVSNVLPAADTPMTNGHWVARISPDPLHPSLKGFALSVSSSSSSSSSVSPLTSAASDAANVQSFLGIPSSENSSSLSSGSGSTERQTPTPTLSSSSTPSAPPTPMIDGATPAIDLTGAAGPLARKEGRHTNVSRANMGRG